MLSTSTVERLPGWRYLGWLCLTLALLPFSVSAQSFTHKELKGLVDDLDRTLRSDLVTNEIRLQMETLRDQVLEAATSREPIEEESIAKVLSEIDAHLSYLLWKKSNTDAAYAKLEALHLSLQSFLGSEFDLAKSDETEGGVSLSAFVTGVKEFLEVIPWWPFLIAVGILYLLRSRGAALRLRSLLRPFSSLKLWGTEFILNKEEARNLARDVERAINESANEISREYDRQVRVNGITGSFASVVAEVKKLRFTEGFRFTLHVPDLLFPDTLYQLLDYHPDGYGPLLTFEWVVVG